MNGPTSNSRSACLEKLEKESTKVQSIDESLNYLVAQNQLFNDRFMKDSNSYDYFLSLEVFHYAFHETFLMIINMNHII